MLMVDTTDFAQKVQGLFKYMLLVVVVAVVVVILILFNIYALSVCERTKRYEEILCKKRPRAYRKKKHTHTHTHISADTTTQIGNVF